jgi:hypothetical protein
MIKNRTVQLIYQTAYCTIGLIGVVACLGIFDDITNFRWDFYVHFTNISNFFCIGVMFAALIQTIKKEQNSYVSACPLIKFIGMLGILLTFLVFNILLAGAAGRDPQANWRIGSLSFHVVLPIMYVLHWILFYEHKKVKWNYPLLSILFPLAYVIFIFIQAVIMKFDTSILIPNTNTPLIYPYFFLNIETQGIMVVGWIFALLAGFVALGYGFYGLDKVIKSKAE